MINRLLKAKHWQLFVLTFAIPVFLEIVMAGIMMAAFITHPDEGPEVMLRYMKFFPLVIIFFMAILFGWFWAIAIGLQTKVPPHINMKVNRFKALLFVPAIYILLLNIGLSTYMTGMFKPGYIPDFRLAGSFFAVIIPLHLFSIFCIFHSMYFVAKTIKTVELQREAGFGDFVGEFFLIWFYPVGIWFIQPKINRMIAA